MKLKTDLESYYAKEARKARQRQDATIAVCFVITFGIIIWSIVR
jgi:hypothetical protein